MEDSKIVAVTITDTHLSESNLEVNRSIFNQVIEFCEDNQIEYIIHDGDVFHSRKSQPQIILTAFEEILDQINDAGLHMFCVTGNHDKTDYRSEKSFLSSFKHHPGLSLIETYGTTEIGAAKLAFLSYFDDDIYIDNLKQLIEIINEPNECILFTHIGVNGARMNNGVAIESGVKASMFKVFKTVKVGHYHDPQSFANIEYFGAGMQHDFGERPNKGLHVLRDDGSLELVELQSPKYLKYEVDVNSLTQKDLDDLREEKQQTDDFLRIILVGEEKDLKSYNIQALKQVGVDVQIKMPEIEITELQTRIEPFTTETLKEQFVAFCDQNQLDLQQGMSYFDKIQSYV